MRIKNTATDRGFRFGGAVTGWFVMMLILMFVGLSVALIALGSQAYRSITQTAEENAQKRTAVGYVINRVHAFDAKGGVRVEEVELEGQLTDVLTLAEWIDGECYETRLFCADGSLREQFTHAQTPLETAYDGEKIVELAEFEVEIAGSMIQVTFTHPDGATDTVHVALRNGGEGQK